MKTTHLLVVGLAFLAAACETTPVGPNAPTGDASIPQGALELGDYRRGSEENVLTGFQREVSGRYGAGLDLSAVSADLRRQQFNCAANRDTRGDPPAQICRKTVTESGCTHTWQVHLFDQAGDDHLARTRGLYDRRCGGDGLLGGPS